MVRSLAQWTKTLSFPSRLSPNRNSKDCSNLNTNTSLLPPPTPPRNKTTNCATSRSSSSTVSTASAASTNSNNNNTNGNNKMPITELEQIVNEIYTSVLEIINDARKTGRSNALLWVLPNSVVRDVLRVFSTIKIFRKIQKYQKKNIMNKARMKNICKGQALHAAAAALE
ncbi:hypothetical protein GQX74_001812 [Glossina fuscipes]|nr:hypothetical protein GQX74_001812 [Glossina fuscipes]